MIIGLDFTSAPRPAKPITWAECHLQGDTLQIVAIHSLVSFTGFEALLDLPGPWVAGMDFPFGQPRRLVENLGWPRTWESYIRLVDEMGKDRFISLLDDYRRDRPYGDKQHLRQADKLAGARSPMMVYRVPVGRMFFEGASRLLHTRLNVLPCRPTADDRVALEAYPALVARRWAPHRSYKSERPDSQENNRQAVRRLIMEGLFSAQAQENYRVRVIMGELLIEKCLVDDTGDSLDAVLCGLQAAWAAQERAHGFGIPEDADPVEGWIIDPSLLT